MRRSFIRSRQRKRQAINPMESVVNLIDIMLIFACGLMVSIASLWNLDLNMNSQINQSGGNTYQDIGRVYQDPVTHKMYIIKPAEDTSTNGAEPGTPSQ